MNENQVNNFKNFAYNVKKLVEENGVVPVTTQVFHLEAAKTVLFFYDSNEKASDHCSKMVEAGWVLKKMGEQAIAEFEDGEIVSVFQAEYILREQPKAESNEE